jgi:hypothetical protein
MEVDDLLRHKDDHPSIGIILCKAKNKVIAEYALRDTRFGLLIQFQGSGEPQLTWYKDGKIVREGT